MKTILSVIILTCFIKLSFAQSHNLIGAWFFNDSENQISMFIKHDGHISITSTGKGNVLFTKDLKEGTYTYKKNLLSIKWPDSNVQKYKVKFIGKDVLVLNWVNAVVNGNQRKIKFRRVINEIRR
jgi:hypothetical protein